MVEGSGDHDDLITLSLSCSSSSFEDDSSGPLEFEGNDSSASELEANNCGAEQVVPYLYCMNPLPDTVVMKLTPLKLNLKTPKNSSRLLNMEW